MAKLRIGPVSGALEIDISEDELVFLLKAIGVKIPFNYASAPTVGIQQITEMINKVEKSHPVIVPPSSDDLYAFLLAKQNYEHDVHEIQEHFFGRQITARENKDVYRKLKYELGKTQKRIEKEKQGAFEERKSGIRNLKRYIFRPLTAIVSKQEPARK